MESPFWHYQSTFDGAALVRDFEDKQRVGRPGYWTSYFGVAVETDFFPDILGPLAGTVEQDMLPANWHADLAEFAAALRAVSLAGDNFSMAELGCGWGCWLNLTGVAARRAGKAVHLVGVEADANHISFAKRAVKANGFTNSEVRLLHGIAAAQDGWALFPNQQGVGSWGLAPIFTKDTAERDRAYATGSYELLPMVALDSLIPDFRRIDLLHMDIQGGEADLVQKCLASLNEIVAYMVIGTHSRQIEASLIEILVCSGWKLEVERALINHLHLDKPLVSIDGVQGWRNPRLLP